MTRHEDRAGDRLRHIIEAIERIITYVGDRDEAGLVADRMALDAVIYNIAIIGEASRIIMEQAPAFVAAHPELPLRQARAIRNRVTHAYDLIDTRIVWLVIKDELPAMRDRAVLALADLAPP